MLGDTYTTIGCVIPTILTLCNKLQQLTAKVNRHALLVQQLNSSQCSRFVGLLNGLQISVPNSSSAFNEVVYKMACALDPT